MDFDALFDAQAKGTVNVNVNTTRPEGFWFEPDPEWDGEWLLWFKCGTDVAFQLMSDAKGNQLDYTVTLKMRTKTGKDAPRRAVVRTIEKTNDRGETQQVAYPTIVNYFDVSLMESIREVIVRQPGLGGAILSRGSDYEIEGTTLVTLQELNDEAYLEIEGKGWGFERAMTHNGKMPSNFSFPTTEVKRGTKAICDVCPNQFACLAGQQKMFGMEEYKVAKLMKGGDPFK
jgi:hypothetical protein